MKGFKYRHGRSTYIMAWVVELCLFAMGISLAVFNIIFGIQSEDLITGTLLAIGWVILGTIELATIPLAGSLRMAKGVNRIYAGAGLLGLLFLSAFTVYEFNEIASEYMTRGARAAAMKVAALEQEAEKHREQIGTIDVFANEAIDKEDQIRADWDKALKAVKNRFEEQSTKAKEYYGNLLSSDLSLTNTMVYNAAERQRIEQFKIRIVDMEMEFLELTDDIRTYKETLTREALERNDSLINSLQKALADNDAQIEKVIADGEKRIPEVKSGFFSSKEKKIAAIQKEVNEAVSQLKLDQKELSSQLLQARAVDFETARMTTLTSKQKETSDSIEAEKSKIKAIEEVALARMDSAEFKEKIATQQKEQDRIFKDRQSTISANLERHNTAVVEIDENYSSAISDLTDSAHSDAEIVTEKNRLNGELLRIAGEITGLIQETSTKFERTMYFRMASWFSDEASTGFGKLPRKKDYNNTLKYIFAPIGLFFGLAAITLAYLGTGFMYDAEREEMGIGPETELRSEIHELKQKIKAQAKHTDELAAREKLSKKRIKELVQGLDQNEKDLIKAKQRIFSAVKAVPQTIEIRADHVEPEQQI